MKVFSVATGRLLRDWIGHDPTSNLSTAVDVTFMGVPPGTPDLTWIDGDQALALATSFQAAKTQPEASKTVTGMVRRLNVAGPANGNAAAGVVSHGKYAPLRIPKSITLSAVDITF